MKINSFLPSDTALRNMLPQQSAFCPHTHGIRKRELSLNSLHGTSYLHSENKRVDVTA